MNRVLVLLLMLLVVLSPLPLGSNREWSWTLCALLAAGLTLLWALTRGWRSVEITRFVHPAIPLLFLVACGWVLIQAAGWVPAGWKHPLWLEMSHVLGEDIPGMIREFLAFDGPAFLEVIIDRNAGVFPMVGPGLSYDNMITGDWIKSREKPADDTPGPSQMF